ncbi:MAG: short-chain dehydrogenase [Candidatus Hydrogenedentota bacterium]
MNATGRSILVTGASTGIGAACALRFDGQGYRVFAGVRNEADADSLRSRASNRLVPVLLDVTDLESVAFAATQIDECLDGGGLFGLVNNAGITVNAPMEFVPIDILRRQIEVNFIGQVAVTQAILPMLRRVRGRIVNMGSIAGRVSLIFGGPYSASKFALEAFTDALRMELSPWGMHVAIVEPGPIATRIWDKGMRQAETLIDSMPPQAREFYGHLIPKMMATVKKTAESAVAPEVVVAKVEHALTSKRPRTRYLVGPNTGMHLMLSRLPDRWKDIVVHMYLNRQ